MTEESRTNQSSFRSSLRELKWILAIWAVSFVWVFSYCAMFGYSTDNEIKLTWGIPSWAFWGVFVPWTAATVVSCWFALTQMEDHPLETEPPLKAESEASQEESAKNG